MIETRICPACQYENELSAILCEGCAVLLPAKAQPQLITEKVVNNRNEAIRSLPAIENLPDLLPQTLVIFAAGADTPIVLETVAKLLLGRPTDDPAEKLLDLTAYEATSLGVSRRHAMVRYRDGGFVIQDLGSTNGTQLNGESLLASREYRLRPYDQIKLGQLKLMVYFQIDEADYVQSIVLEDVKAPKQRPLTPSYLAEILLPYLYALSELQKAYKDCLQRPQVLLQVRQIQAVQTKNCTRLQLLGADDVVKLVRKWIVPWQRINSVTLVPEQQLMKEMVILVAYMVKEGMPTATSGCRERLLNPVVAIAMSGLLLTVEEDLS